MTNFNINPRMDEEEWDISEVPQRRPFDYEIDGPEIAVGGLSSAVEARKLRPFSKPVPSKRELPRIYDTPEGQLAA